MSFTKESDARERAVRMAATLPGNWIDQTYKSPCSGNWIPRVVLNKYVFIDCNSDSSYVCFISVYGKDETSVVSGEAINPAKAYLKTHADFIHKLSLYITAENEILRDTDIRPGATH